MLFIINNRMTENMNGICEFGVDSFIGLVNVLFSILLRVIVGFRHLSPSLVFRSLSLKVLLPLGSQSY